MAKIENILFDWDGCLADTLELWIEAWNETFSGFGVEIGREEVVEKAFRDWEYPVELGIEDIKEFHEGIYRLVDKKMPNCSLNEGALEVVKKLYGAEKKIAVVTSSRVKTIMPAIKATGLTPYVDVILGEENVEKLKPDPEIIQLALTKMGGSSENSIIVGDSVTDMLAGAKAGIARCLYLPKENQRIYNMYTLKQTKPDYTIEHFQELLQILKIV